MWVCVCVGGDTVVLLDAEPLPGSLAAVVRRSTRLLRGVPHRLCDVRSNCGAKQRVWGEEGEIEVEAMTPALV